jgi:D-threo-aldose 1-dehydrogenase
VSQPRAISFGSAQLDLGALGFGCAPLGNLYRAIDDCEAIAAVAAALAKGISYFDTAPHYGFGLSETRLGRALRACSTPEQRVVVSTKVGRLLVPSGLSARLRHGFVDTPPLAPIFDYSYDGVMRSFEESLRRLGRSSVDILFAHDLGELTHGAEHARHFRAFMDGGYSAMHELKAAGAIKAIGLGANEWQVCAEALALADFDGFLLAGRYSLLEQGAAESFLPLCAARGLSVIVGGPFNSGILATGVNSAAQAYYNYEQAPLAIVERVRRIEIICADYAVALPAAALQFPLAHPQVANVVAGFASAQQLQQACTWLQTPISPACWQALIDEKLLPPDVPLPRPLLPPQESAWGSPR